MLGEDVRRLVQDCGAGRVPGATIADDGSWWIPTAWVHARLDPSQAAPRATTPRTAKNRWGLWLFVGAVGFCLVSTVAVTLPSLLFGAGVGTVAVGVASFKIERLRRWARLRPEVVISIGSLVAIVGLAGVYRLRQVERREIQERQRARMAAQDRAAEEAERQQAERARLEELRQAAPSTITAWRAEVDRARRQLLEEGSLPDLEVFVRPSQGECPTVIEACAEAAREHEATRQELAPLLTWLSAVEQLAALRPDIDAPTTLSAETLERWRQILAQAEALPADCPPAVCTRARRQLVRQTRRDVERRARDVVVPVANTEQVKLRYADLRESQQPARVQGVTLTADTYHNCVFRSHSRWRGFVIRSPGDYWGIHVYCHRGDAWCDELHRRALSAPALGTALLRYPRTNPVCEQTQAELLGFQ